LHHISFLSIYLLTVVTFSIMWHKSGPQNPT